jgi:hypothetical protein
VIQDRTLILLMKMAGIRNVWTFCDSHGLSRATLVRASKGMPIAPNTAKKIATLAGIDVDLVLMTVSIGRLTGNRTGEHLSSTERKNKWRKENPEKARAYNSAWGQRYYQGKIELMRAYFRDRSRKKTAARRAAKLATS